MPKKSKGKKSILKRKTNKTTSATSQSADYSDDSLNEYEEAQLREAILASKKEYEIQQSEIIDNRELGNNTEGRKDGEEELLQYEKRNLYIYKKIKTRYERKIKEAAKERIMRVPSSNIDESDLSMNEKLKLRLKEYALEEDQFVIEILETKIKTPKIKIFSSMEELRALSSSPSRSSLSSYSHSSSSTTAAATNSFIKRPKPDYNQYLDKLFTKQPWMTKKDIKYLTDLFTKPESIASCASIKRIINVENFNSFTNEQKIRIMKLIPIEDIVPIASITGEPIDTPYIERERTYKDEFLYEAGIHGQITGIDPMKVTPRFDFWLSDDVKDARWWWQLSIEYGYYTKYGVNQQWDEYENFRCNLPSHWKSDAFEEMWGEILKEGVGNVQLAGDSAKITLPDLVKAKVIKEGDILIYKRSFAKLDITVTTELEVLRVNRNNGCMAVKFGKGKNFRVIEDVQRPTSLEKEILDFDGRIPKSSRPHGNAFKNLSIVKSESYKPSLFEVRKEYWTKNNTIS
ncbi:8574_t:CDS:2 [Entrophospora sp. SA101]|nr:13219_t:CDS:2 [Entrophospora sp. SA101]CAJ0632080.1 6290_t:CDS:2 [Entrophospora sp. SA101]CAJ0754935.1 8574_t:CDS:2 [Entrophospora sp. SA101]CAJ0829433.1 20054_t:CDS:2 [Entrophospora sp. SA101]CAJ0845952.1 14744_t:CDS:2 [Entrophospora sp. SA101]